MQNKGKSGAVIEEKENKGNTQFYQLNGIFECIFLYSHFLLLISKEVAENRAFKGAMLKNENTPFQLCHTNESVAESSHSVDVDINCIHHPICMYKTEAKLFVSIT